MPARDIAPKSQGKASQVKDLTISLGLATAAMFILLWAFSSGGSSSSSPARQVKRRTR